MKKIILFCLMLGLLTVAACSREGGEVNDALGRYVEIEITPPIEGRFMSFVTSDDRIIAVNQNLSQMFSSADGGDSWTELPLDVDTDELWVTAGTIMPDDRFLVFVQDEGLAVLSADGTRESFPVAEIDTPISQGRQVMVSFMQVLGDNRLLMEYTVMDNIPKQHATYFFIDLRLIGIF